MMTHTYMHKLYFHSNLRVADSKCLRAELKEMHIQNQTKKENKNKCELECGRSKSNYKE